MASFKKLPSGLWQAQIFRRGVRTSASFPTKAAAQAWAGREEAKIIAGNRGEAPSVPDMKFAALLDRYAREVSATKKGSRWEAIRIDLLKRDEIALVPLRSLDAVHVSAWRDRRLQAVSGASVRREWNLLSHACNIAVREWRWLARNPFHGVRRPKDNRSRDRLPTPKELAKLSEVATSPPYQKALAAFLFACETGMRAGEICGLQAIQGRVAKLEDTKNGTRREVALSAKAMEIWAEHGPFGITAGTLTQYWIGLCRDAGIEDLHFHDSRHYAITKLSGKLELLELARMVGIRDLRILMVYYNKSAEEIADKL